MVLSFLRPPTTLNGAIVAKMDAVIARMGSKKDRMTLQIMNRLANFAPSYGKRVR
jgi:hypothetical protein